MLGTCGWSLKMFLCAVPIPKKRSSLYPESLVNVLVTGALISIAHLLHVKYRAQVIKFVCTEMIRIKLKLLCSVTRFGDFLHIGQLFKVFGSN